MTMKNLQPKRTPLDQAPLRSLKELEFLLGVPRAELLRLAEWEQHYAPFSQSRAPKPHSQRKVPTKLRVIDNPKDELKVVQSRILKRLLLPVQLPGFLFGAVSGRSIREHAQVHLGAKLVVKMDIKSYYPSITNQHIFGVWRDVLGCSGAVASLLTKLTTCAYHLPQGAPTSPALANLFLASIYSPVLATCQERGICVSAWVDDLTFSGSRAREVMETVRQTLALHGFKDSRKKRVVLGPRDRKLITGVRLGSNGPRACRLKMRDVRAGIDKLRKRVVTAQGWDKDVQSLQGKIAHIRNLCPPDAAPLQDQLARVLASSAASTKNTDRAALISNSRTAVHPIA